MLSGTQTTYSRVTIIKYSRRGLEYQRPTGLERSNALDMMGGLRPNGWEQMSGRQEWQRPWNDSVHTSNAKGGGRKFPSGRWKFPSGKVKWQQTLVIIINCRTRQRPQFGSARSADATKLRRQTRVRYDRSWKTHTLNKRTASTMSSSESVSYLGEVLFQIVGIQIDVHAVSHFCHVIRSSGL